jgi:hypothetical protein
MSVPLSIQRVLDATLPTFQSVDIRTFALKTDDSSYNAITSIGFNEETVEFIKCAILHDVESQPPFNDDRLEFHWKVIPVANLPELIEQFKTGFVEFPGRRVDLMRPVNLLEFQGYINSIRYLERRPNWPSFQSQMAWSIQPNVEDTPEETARKGRLLNRLKQLNYDSDLRRSLHASGFDDLRELFHSRLQSRPDSDPSCASEIYIDVPIRAAVREVKFDPRESRLSSIIDCHSSLCTAIQVWAEQRSNFGRKGQKVRLAPLECLSDGASSVDAPLRLDDETTSIVISLSHNSLGKVTEFGKNRKDILPKEETNSLWWILQAFCPIERFESELTAPTPQKTQAEREQRSFERYVAWLLSLFGYCPIVLGEFEYLHVGISKVRLGSVDIIAYHKERNRVLLCSCTMGAPEERDYGNLVTVRSDLQSRINQDVSFIFELAIISCAAQCVAPRHYSTAASHVALLDRGDLKDSIRWLQSGEDSAFFRKIDPPPGLYDWADAEILPSE